MERFKKNLLKLTLFDKILILITVLGVAFFGYYFFRKPNYKNAVVKVSEDSVLYAPWKKDSGVSSWFEQYFQVGMREVNGLGQTTAEIENISSYDTGPTRKDLYLNVKLNSVFNRATGIYTFKGRPLIAGSTIKINFDGVYVEGLVTFVDGLNDKREKIKLKVEAQLLENNPVFSESEGVRKTLADAINIGDEVVDNRGNIVLKVVGKNMEDSRRLINTSDGRTIVSNNPYRKDVILILEAQGYKLNNRYYLFDNLPILVGQNIPFNTPYVSVFPEVTKITVLE